MNTPCFQHDAYQASCGDCRSMNMARWQEEAMGPRSNPRQPIFRDHNCWKCRDGELPCTGRRDGDYGCCEYPHARND